ncbi:hypothetical protein PVAP13_3KG382227 [Panicum virgatum]|uniref:TTF-type domain-containing protein n=1 Tax=Panicum virgatum TaxID=38727 RepID=A0A8T0V0E3_PANVG|nr:hypothetical protein PVAP13_3KG382227 [Panicum virgatum]
MKRMKQGDIASLFRRHDAKKNEAPSLSIAVVSILAQEQEDIGMPSSPAAAVPSEDVSPVLPPSPALEDVSLVLPPSLPRPTPPPPIYDPDCLPQDPEDRLPIVSYPTNYQDAVRRAYIIKGPFKPFSHQFKKRKIGTRDRSFNPIWLHHYHWLEYSIKNDAAFCFVCYLFKNKKGKGKGTETFTELRLYKIRLTYSIRCLKFLLHQGLAFRGHDETEESSNRGNFLELLKWLASNNEEVDKYVLKNAPGNCTLTCPDIQKKIIQCCAIETINKIIEELGDDHYAILADESSDVSHKEQLAVCLRFVDKLARPCEHFLGIVHEAIQSLLTRHHLTLSQIRGQGYDGASNMKGEIRGLETLIMKESPSAYYIHCFAHQLQLVLVAVAKGNNDCVWFFDQVSLLLNIVAVSSKRHDMIRNINLQNILKAIECEKGLARPVLNIICMYPTIRDSGDWPKIHTMVGVLESFDFVFSAHLMFTILGYTNELSECLQRRDQDILNAISLVNVAKNRMQQLRADGWIAFLQKVTLFCNKFGIHVPAMEDVYVPYGRSRRREVYIGAIDQISQELDTRFDEVNMELLSCMAALNPSNLFASFDSNNNAFQRLEMQLDNYIDDLRKDDSFKDQNNLVDLLAKLVETHRDKVYDLMYLLLKLVLILPVATASVERAFSAMNSVKNKSRNRLSDNVLDAILCTYIEREIFSKVNEDDILETFMAMRKCRPDKK